MAQHESGHGGVGRASAFPHKALQPLSGCRCRFGQPKARSTTHCRTKTRKPEPGAGRTRLSSRPCGCCSRTAAARDLGHPAAGVRS